MSLEKVLHAIVNRLDIQPGEKDALLEKVSAEFEHETGTEGSNAAE